MQDCDKVVPTIYTNYCSFNYRTFQQDVEFILIEKTHFREI